MMSRYKINHIQLRDWFTALLWIVAPRQLEGLCIGQYLVSDITSYRRPWP